MNKLLYLFGGWLLFIVSCTSGEPTGVLTDSSNFIRFSEQQADSISMHPREVRRKAFLAMQQVQDSVVKYSYLSIIIKTYLVVSQLDSALYYLKPLERFVTQSPSTPRLDELYADYLNTRGNCFVRAGYADSAIHYYRQAYNRQRRGEKRASSVDILINLADAYTQRGSLDEGAAWFRHALMLCDSLQLPFSERFPIYYGLGQIYVWLRDFERCDYYYNLAGQQYSSMRPSEKQFYLNNRGTSYYYRQDYTTAISYFHQLIRLTEEYPDMTFERNLGWLNLADCYVCLQQADSAAHYIGLCEPFFRSYGMPAALYSVNTQKIGVALLRHNLSEARQLLQQSVSSADVYPDLIHVRNRGMQLYYEYTHNYQKAYEFLKLNTQLNDSIRNERIHMRTADLALRYQQDSTLMSQKVLIQKKENEVLSLRQNFFIMLGLSLFACLVGAFLYMYNKKKRALLQEQNRREVSSLRLENIRNRLSPHFIFNVLNQEMSSRQEQDRHELAALVKLMRRNLELAEQLCVTLAEELDFVQTYLILEQRSLGDKFVFAIQVDETISVTDVSLPSMLIQIPVENAVKHALRNKEGERRLWIRISKGVDNFKIQITDNGGGYRPQSRNRGTGTGMKVIMQTIQILNAKNEKSIDVTVHNVTSDTGEVGCEVAFLIPFQYNYSIES